MYKGLTAFFFPNKAITSAQQSHVPFINFSMAGKQSPTQIFHTSPPKPYSPCPSTSTLTFPTPIPQVLLLPLTSHSWPVKTCALWYCFFIWIVDCVLSFKFTNIYGNRDKKKIPTLSSRTWEFAVEKLYKSNYDTIPIANNIYKCQRRSRTLKRFCSTEKSNFLSRGG